MSRARALVFLVLALAGAAFLVQLGFWQLSRMEWKRGLITQMEQALAGNQSPLSPEQAEQRFAAEPWADYLPVEARGRYAGPTLWLYAIVDGKPGWHAVDLLMRENGKPLLIDRGGLPEAQRASIQRPEGEVAVRGFARRPQAEAGAFQPASDTAKGIYYWRDAGAMGAGAAFAFLVERLPEAGDAPWPRAQKPDPAGLPNNHLDYALTWFSLAGLLVGLTGWFLWTGRKSSTPRQQP